MRTILLGILAAAGLVAGCAASEGGPEEAGAAAAPAVAGGPVRVDFETGAPGEPPPAELGGATLAAPSMAGLLITETAPLAGRQSLCAGGIGAGRRFRIEAPDARGLGNDLPLTLGFDFRMVGFGKAEIAWEVSGARFRVWRMIMAQAVQDDAEPEPIGGFFTPEQAQPLFLFERGGSYRVAITVDPVERAPFRGLRQYRIVVTDIGTPDDEKVVYDSYAFFTPDPPVPASYTGQALDIGTEQADPGGWPCLESALILDEIRFGREE